MAKKDLPAFVKTEPMPDFQENIGGDLYLYTLDEIDGEKVAQSLLEEWPKASRFITAALALARLAYGFRAYPQGLAGGDPLMGVKRADISDLRDKAHVLLEAADQHLAEQE